MGDAEDRKEIHLPSQETPLEKEYTPEIRRYVKWQMMQRKG